MNSGRDPDMSLSCVVEVNAFVPASMDPNHLNTFLGDHVNPIVIMTFTVKRLGDCHVLTSEVL